MTKNQKIGATAGAVVVAAGIVAGVLMSGGPTNVPAGADLQAAINAASTGDTLQLANATYSGNFVENKGLTIVGPAKITTPDNDVDGRPALYYPPSTPPATLRNLEITHGNHKQGTIIKYGDQGAIQDTLDEQPQGLTIENVDIHGLPNQESQRGIAANGRNFQLINSKVREIHGVGYDTQAVCAWNGAGPFELTGNYLEAAGENVMFGGADPSIPNLIPSDITIKRNHFFKPLTWKVGHPTYAGRHWTIKNLFETKNARRLVVEGNIFENNWTDAQAGAGIVIKCNNQDGTAPWSVTEDLLFQYNTVISEAGINMLLIENPPKVSAIGKRIYYRHNLLKVERLPFQGPNSGEDVRVEHNTWTSTISSVFMLYGNPTKGLVFSNNLGQRAEYGVKGDGTGEGTAALNAYSPAGWAFAGNVISGASPTQYPANNFYPATWEEVQLGADYRLASTSPYKGKATDGADPGVDMDALLAAQSSPTVTPSPSVSVTATPTPLSSPSPSPTLTPTPAPIPSPTPQPSPCPMTAWPSSVAGQNQKMEQQRALGCYPVRRPASGQGMEYARP